MTDQAIDPENIPSGAGDTDPQFTCKRCGASGVTLTKNEDHLLINGWHVSCPSCGERDETTIETPIPGVANPI